MRRLRLASALFGFFLTPWAGAAEPAPQPQPTTPPSAPGPHAEPAAPEGAPTAETQGPPTGPPPQYYVEPQQQPPAAATPAAPPTVVYEPPPPPYGEPPPPHEPTHRVPRSALWAGLRLSWLSPLGSLWLDGFDYGRGIYYQRRSFADYASAGPALELDLGARLSRHYNVFALWEHATLGTGSLDEHSFGGQQRGAANLYGVGVRYSSDPSSLGLLIEVALGYRDFRAYWADGTTLTMSDGWLDARVGIGADIRLGPSFSLSPMFTLAGGSFSTGSWSGPSMRGSAFTELDGRAGYTFVSFQLGAHLDVL